MKSFTLEGSGYSLELYVVIADDRVVYTRLTRRCWTPRINRRCNGGGGLGYREKMVAEMASCGAACLLEDG